MSFTRRFCTFLTKEHFTHYLKGVKNFEQYIKNLKVVSLENGKCVAELKIEESHDPLDRGYKSFIPILVDSISSYGLASLESGNRPHVSVSIKIRYLNPSKFGQTLTIETETVKCGKKLAFLEATIKEKETDTIIAKGEHTKFLL